MATVTDNSTLTYTNAGTISDTIVGSGSVTFQGTATPNILTANNTYTGGTTISQGALVVGNGGTSGAIVGDVVAGVTTSNSGINFARSDNITFAGNISGLGYVAQQGTGVLTLAGNNSYGSTTDVGAGTLAFSSDSNLGTGDVRLIGGGSRFAQCSVISPSSGI